MKIYLPIDQKSLYFNIKNDNQSGHTATVATPLKQGGSIHKELSAIYNIPEKIVESSRESLVSQIVSGSRAAVRIPNIYCFENIAVNGISIESNYGFCIYIREETDPSNVHFGRLKVHYPPSLVFDDENTSINNKEIIKLISEKLQNYAFVIEGFEYDTDYDRLNFDAVVIGPHNTPYSKIFVNKKGVGNKFSPIFNEYADIYDAEIIALRDKLGYDKISPDNFMDVELDIKKKTVSYVSNFLKSKGFSKIKCINENYPYSLYDIEYDEDGFKKYVIVSSTATKIAYFNMTYQKVKFMNDFEKKVSLVLVTDILGNPSLHWYDVEALNQMTKTINSITYEDR